MEVKILIDSMSAFFEKAKLHVWTIGQVILGSLCLAALSQVRIPFYPVPMTLQTLGIFLLAIGQGRRKGLYSTLFYLVLATLGFPVLSGGIPNSLWFVSPVAGYLLGFPIASYVIGKMVYAKKDPSPLWVTGSVLMGQLIIYILGIGGLGRFLGFKQSIMLGLIPFLPLAGMKLLIASCIGVFWIRYKKDQ